MKKHPKTKFELLAPAGDFMCLHAAVNAGADAVYFGLQEGMNMRASAQNFRLGDLKKIREICENRGGKKVKRYLALNTIIYDSEIRKVENIIKKAKPNISAVICWDPVIIGLCRKYRIPFHISTQASVSSTESAKFYKKLGAESITLARELSLKQIKKISKIIPAEVFIHGAMCVSVSGRCFTSQFLFGRSANRGECAHPCRKSYTIEDEEGNRLKLDNNIVMSAKDLCALPFMEQLKKAGITRFKIEGRNKEPEYVETATKVYRKALDKKLAPEEIAAGMAELKKVYNKGFSSGFFLGMPTNDDFSKVQHSSATQKKLFVGKIEHYFPKAEVAAVRITDNKIKTGDELIILGKNNGVLRKIISRMEIDRMPVKSAKKGQVVGIKISGAEKGGEVYLIKKRKYDLQYINALKQRTLTAISPHKNEDD